MTNSSETKPQKVKGPIRTEAVVPFLIFVLLIWAYFFFLFDGHLRHLIEFAGGKVHGAQVDVASVHTSFWKGSFTLNGLEVTDKEKPAQNAISVDKMHFQFLWDALLRAKFVVSDASIENIQVQSPRKSPGKVYPVPEEEKVNEESGKPSVAQNALAQAGDMLKGMDPTKDLKDVGELKSLKRIEELQKELGQKDKEWQAQAANLISSQEIANIQNKIKNLKVGGSSNLGDLQKQISEANQVLNEANGKINETKQKGQALVSQISQFSGALGEVDKLIQADKAALEARLKLPSLDAGSLSKQLFSQMIYSKLGEYAKYIRLAQKHMPPKGAASKPKSKEDQIKARERARGVNFSFPVARGYPLFWLKHAGLSSKADHSPFGGNIQGEILDVASDPSLIGKPIRINFAGDFPNQKIQGIDAKITLDHTTETAQESFVARVASFPVQEQMFSNSDSLKFGFRKAQGSTKMDGVYKSGTLQFSSESVFENIDFLVDSQTALVKELLQNAMKETPKVTVSARAKGSLDNLNVEVESNLGAALQASLGKQLKGKVDEARKKIDEMIQSKVGGKKQELTQQFSQTQAKANQSVTEKTKQAEGLKSMAEAKVNEAKSSGPKPQLPGGVKLPF